MLAGFTMDPSRYGIRWHVKYTHKTLWQFHHACVFFCFATKWPGFSRAMASLVTHLSV
jgi:hypothetical protein